MKNLRFKNYDYIYTVVLSYRIPESVFANYQRFPRVGARFTAGQPP